MENQVRRPDNIAPVTLTGDIFRTSQSFELAQRMSRALASSTIVPNEYRDNVGNCMIALEMANRMNVSPLMVMQNLHIINGRPAWSSQYIVAMINHSKKYKTELQYELEGQGDDRYCYAYAYDHNDHKVTGPTINIKMAKDEGWYQKNGSKWKTMPDVMLRYRAASFFGRLNCPDMIMGIYSADEVVELDESEYAFVEAKIEAQEEIEQNANKIDIEDVACDNETGEVIESEMPEDVERSAPEADF